MNKKLLSLTCILMILGFNMNAQLIGKNKDKKYLIYSFSELGDDRLPNFGKIYEVRMYFRDVANQAVRLFIETSANPNFMVADMSKLDDGVLFPTDAEENYDVSHSISELTFLESPWKNQGLKKGVLHFIATQENPRKMTAIIYFHFDDKIRIMRLKGVVEDDLILK
ncbi:hypothetical protein V7S78_07575 [Aquirufa regiilacus]